MIAEFYRAPQEMLTPRVQQAFAIAWFNSIPENLRKRGGKKNARDDMTERQEALLAPLRRLLRDGATSEEAAIALRIHRWEAIKIAGMAGLRFMNRQQRAKVRAEKNREAIERGKAEGLSRQALARSLGVSGPTVARMIDVLGIDYPRVASRSPRANEIDQLQPRIEAMLRAGKSQEWCAVRYEVSESTVASIARGERQVAA